MKIIKNKIDRLVDAQARLIVKKQKIEDRKNETNSRIETEIKALENKAFRNKQIADGKLAELDREIAKNKEQISLEARYYNKLAGAVKGGKDE